MTNYVLAMYLLFIVFMQMVSGSTDEIRKLQAKLDYQEGRVKNIDNKIVEVEMKINQNSRKQDLLNQQLEKKNEIITTFTEREKIIKIQKQTFDKIKKFENVSRPKAIQILQEKQIEIDELNRAKDVSKSALEKKKKEMEDFMQKEEEKLVTLKKDLEEKIQTQIKTQESLKHDLNKEKELKIVHEDELIEPRANKKARQEQKHLEMKQKIEQKKKMKEDEKNKFSTPKKIPKTEIIVESPIKENPILSKKIIRKMMIKENLMDVTEEELQHKMEESTQKFLEKLLDGDILVTKEGKTYDGEVMRELYKSSSKKANSLGGVHTKKARKWANNEYLALFKFTTLLHNVDVPKPDIQNAIDGLRKDKDFHEFSEYFNKCQEFIDAGYIRQKRSPPHCKSTTSDVLSTNENYKKEN